MMVAEIMTAKICVAPGVNCAVLIFESKTQNALTDIAEYFKAGRYILVQDDADGEVLDTPFSRRGE